MSSEISGSPDRPFPGGQAGLSHSRYHVNEEASQFLVSQMPWIAFLLGLMATPWLPLPALSHWTLECV